MDTTAPAARVLVGGRQPEASGGTYDRRYGDGRSARGGGGGGYNHGYRGMFDGGYGRGGRGGGRGGGYSGRF
jgi:hypothetical protein